MRYFAYGSNMDPVQMADRCPGAVSLGKARLDGYRLTFTYDSRFWGGGVGHVEDSADDHVWGVLWDLTDEHVVALDRYERVHKGVYIRGTATVQFDDRPTEALIYLCTTDSYRRPSRKYIAALVRGAQEHALPPAYVRHLESFLDRSGREASE